MNRRVVPGSDIGMTDDSNARYRSDDRYGRTPAHGESGNDPLAELARLIGQNDPFSQLGRVSRATPEHESYHTGEPSHSGDWHGSATPAADYDPAPAGSYAQPAAGSDPHHETHSYAAD